MMRCLVPLLLFLLVCTVRATPNGYFWQITDIHYDPTYETTQESCNDYIENPGKYGDFECDPPWTLAHSSVKAMSTLHGTPDFILWMGDNTPHPKNKSALNVEKVIAFLENTTALIRTYFTQTPIIVTLGNHDYYPKNQLPGETNTIYQAAADMWKDWLGDGYETFKRGAYYTTLLPTVDEKLRAVIVNTNLYLTSNMATENMEDPGDQLAWFRDVMASARTQQEKVHVILHVPVGVMERTGNPEWIREAPNRDLNEIFREYSDIIIGMYSAHTHSDSFRIFYDEEDTPRTSMFIAPSVTPWRARIGNGIKTAAHNPGIRQITFDKSTFQLTNVIQYYLNLNAANQQNKDNWIMSYSFTSMYGVQGVSPTHLHELTEKFSEYANEEFHEYYEMNTVRARELSNEPCSCECKFEHICAMKHVDFDAFDTCKKTITCGAQRMTVSVTIFALLLFKHLL